VARFGRLSSSVIVNVGPVGLRVRDGSSCKLERATYDSVAFHFIAANDHPDHDTIATFWSRFLKDIEALFVRMLELAREVGLLGLAPWDWRARKSTQCQPAQRAVL
jgi:hypothetical protein